MVCNDCEKKLKQQGSSDLACPDPFAKRALMDGLEVGKSTGPRNMLLGKKGNARTNNPYDKKCNDCKQKVHDGGLYCQDCAYSKGVCRICAKVVLTGREFYKSFVSDAQQAKYAPKNDRTKEAQPNGGGDSGAAAGGEGEAFDANASDTTTEERPKKKAKKVKRRDDGGDASKRKALEEQQQQKEAAAAMVDFVADPASGYLYNAKTQQYYDPKSGVYYTHSDGVWYFFNQATNAYQACQAAADPGPPASDPGPPAGAPPQVQTPAEIAAEIAGHAGPGSMPLEEARKKAKPAFGGLRGGA